MALEQWFQGRVALVTGGGGGIGQAAALLFAKRGARVVIADQDGKGAKSAVDEIAADGGEAIAVAGDISVSGAAEALVRRALERFGRLDVAFNNAGITDAKDGQWDETAFRRTMEINLHSVMACMKHEIAAMLEGGGGAIVNNASINGLIASARLPLPGYTASKHALIGLTKSAALQYVKQNIRVNSVCPGITDTAIIQRAIGYSPDARAAIESSSPLGRMARPEEVAEAAVWLASDKASFVNAHALVVDAGYVAH